MLENEYRHNKRFREYVDRYCAERGIDVREALQHGAVRRAFLMYTEAERRKQWENERRKGLRHSTGRPYRKGLHMQRHRSGRRAAAWAGYGHRREAGQGI